jgi:hypothetical protein
MLGTLAHNANRLIQTLGSRGVKMEVDGRRMLIEMAIISAVLLFIIQFASSFPLAKTLNSSDSPIDEEVEFTVSSFLGQTVKVHSVMRQRIV